MPRKNKGESDTPKQPRRRKGKVVPQTKEGQIQVDNIRRGLKDSGFTNTPQEARDTDETVRRVEEWRKKRKKEEGN